jgi:hypothetical protein
MRKTLIFGNGIGMALWPEQFSLRNALNDVWSRQETISDDQKALIRSCLPKQRHDGPNGEEDLATLQEVVTACKVLRGIGVIQGNHWLTQEGMRFPLTIQAYIHAVANTIFLAQTPTGQACLLPEGFSDPLRVFVAQTSSHVATLNYDGLLYCCVQDTKKSQLGRTTLLDGFIGSHFRRENLFRKDSGSAGWYLHLHGSPLFFTDSKGKPRKRKERMKVDFSEREPHLVLAHTEHKESTIASSIILSTYWEFLGRAIDESAEVTLFGYSGHDTHLNKLLAQRASKKVVRVVEWIGSGLPDLRFSFWKSQIGRVDSHVQLESILEFHDW